MARVEVFRTFALPVDRVYAYLSEHENLGPVFGAKITRVRDGDTSRNGEGSVRRLQIAVLPSFEETITTAEPDRLIEYRITKGSPLRGHRGRMEFAPADVGSTLHYVIEFGAVVPGLDRVVAAVLQRAVTKGLARVDLEG